MRKNLFKLPSGAASKRYIREKTRLTGIWNASRYIALKIKNGHAVLMQKTGNQMPSRTVTILRSECPCAKGSEINPRRKKTN